MTMIIRDIMLGNDKLNAIGRHEEAIGRNAIAGGFQGQRMWTDYMPNGDFAEAITNSSFNWNGKKEPLVLATENDTLNGVAMLFEKLLNHPTGEYRRILVCRPNAQFDDDIGFLPGDEQEKISPLMRPIIDNLEQLIDSSEEERYQDEDELKGKIDEIFERGIIQAEALNYIRGRSIVKTYLIIDEAQNTTPDQIKGIITRAGRDTKIILLGDPNQIDRPFLDERTNGLSYASEHMKGSRLCWQLTMTTEECERSALAMEAVRRL